MSTVVNRLRGTVADRPIDVMVTQPAPGNQSLPSYLDAGHPIRHSSGNDTEESAFDFLNFLNRPQLRQALSNIQDAFLQRQHLYDKG